MLRRSIIVIGDSRREWVSQPQKQTPTGTPRLDVTSLLQTALFFKASTVVPWGEEVEVTFLGG